MGEQLNLFDEFSFYEGDDVEYKSAKGGLPGDLWETYSAFANSGGGTIWLGVAQKSGRLDVHGVADPEKLLSDFWNTINNPGKINVNLLSSKDVSIVSPSPDGPRVVRIQVPRADRRQRPVFVGSNPLRGTFRRNHEGDYRCTEAEVRRMFSDQSEEPADSRILKGFSLNDIHAESLRQFRTLFGARIQHVWQSEDDRGLLEKLGGWRRDRGSGAEGLTVAGLLMFGREQAIRDPAAIPGFHLDYRERFSDDPAVRWTDRLTLDGTWEGNLFQFYQRVMLKLSSGPGVKRPFQMNAEGYRVAGTPIVEALQEALVNALIHADYAGQGGIIIDRWIDRLEFSNPGSLLVSRDQLLRGGISECRNKSLQLMFQMLGAGDKAGSGIDKIRAGWASEHWISPSLRETRQPDRVLLSLPMISTLPDEVLTGLERRFGEQFKVLGPDEVQALVTASLEGEVTNLRLQETLTLHRVDITRMLRGLVKSGLLDQEGTGRGTRYTLTGNGAVGDENTPHKPPSPPINTPLSDVVGDDELLAIAAPVRGAKRTSPELMQKTLLALCTERFLTIQQLADLVGRETEKLRDRHVSPLVEAGRLEMRFPAMPRHREQAYRAVPPAPGNEENS